MSKHRRQAFLRGFAAGMASPFTFLLPQQSRYDDLGPGGLVARSWERVGAAMESAMGIEQQRQIQVHDEAAEEDHEPN